MEYKVFPLGYWDINDNLKYIFIILNIFIDNDLLDKDYLIMDKKDHWKRLMNFSNIGWEITFTKWKDWEKYKLDLENKKIVKYWTDIEYKWPLFDEFPTKLLASIGFFELNSEDKIILWQNIINFKILLNKLSLNNFDDFSREKFDNEEIKSFLTTIFYESSLYIRINEYIKLLIDEETKGVKNVFDDNIRDFLGLDGNEVNSNMFNRLTSDSSQLFGVLNNTYWFFTFNKCCFALA